MNQLCHGKLLIKKNVIAQCKQVFEYFIWNIGFLYFCIVSIWKFPSSQESDLLLRLPDPWARLVLQAPCFQDWSATTVPQPPLRRWATLSTDVPDQEQSCDGGVWTAFGLIIIQTGRIHENQSISNFPEERRNPKCYWLQRQALAWLTGRISCAVFI